MKLDKIEIILKNNLKITLEANYEEIWDKISTQGTLFMRMGNIIIKVSDIQVIRKEVEEK